MRKPVSNDNVPKRLQVRDGEGRDVTINTILYWGLMVGTFLLAVAGWRAVGIG